ncbi:MAG: type II toxin-antitoxin system RelE/ParE family toxin [Coriobacteriales bacterium]|nr:type II toxin-antitoxin system RelE/ParE family toxin [Coriobacteriales bacterium]
MTKLIYSHKFIEDAGSVREAIKRQEIKRQTDALAEFPLMGTPGIPASISRTFGPQVRMLVVNPFNVVYEYDEKTDVVMLLGLVHQSRAW